jgi:hypothetical protein
MYLDHKREMLQCDQSAECLSHRRHLLLDRERKRELPQHIHAHITHYPLLGTGLLNGDGVSYRDTPEPERPGQVFARRRPRDVLSKGGIEADEPGLAEL